MRRPAFVLSILISLPACSASIPYPSTPAGRVLRDFYTAPDAVPDNLYVALNDETKITAADRITLQPAMLAILRHDHSQRALFVAHILAEWNPALASTAPEFRRLLPAIAAGLDAPNGNDEMFTRHWSAAGSTILISRMGPDAARSIKDAVARRLNAPVTAPIVGESDEAWTRLILAGILCSLGKDGVPALAQGLKHPDPFVRQATYMALQSFFPERESRDTPEKLPPWFSPQWLATTQQQLRALTPHILEYMQSSNAPDSKINFLDIPGFFRPEFLADLAKNAPNPKIRAAAQQALDKTAHQPTPPSPPHR